MRKIWLAITGMVFLTGFSAGIKAEIRIEALQPPVTIIRDQVGYSRPPGSLVRPGELIRTGNGGKAVLWIDGKIRAKLGSNASLLVLSGEEDEGGLKPVLRSIGGALRLTTLEPQAEGIDIVIGQVATRLADGDVWSRVNPERDVVLLIEGTVDLAHPGKESFALTTPLSFATLNRNEGELPVRMMNIETLAEYAQETELDQGGGVANSSGQWVINLLSAQDRDYVEKRAGILGAQGFPAEVVDVTIDGKPWHRLIMRGFISREDADFIMQAIDGHYEINSPWLQKIN